MSDRPVITTPRLVLRPFTIEDASDVQRLAGDERVAREIPLIPHPYPDGLAESWIDTHEASEERHGEIIRAITLKDTGAFVGCISLARTGYDHCAELGYWTGVDFWGRGYVTEAAQAFTAWAFEQGRILRIQSHHAMRNPRSGRIMQKVGMRRESVMRGRLHLRGELHDVVTYGMLRDDAPQDLSQDLRLECFPQERRGVRLRAVTMEDVDARLCLFCSPGVYEGLASIPRAPDLDFALERTRKCCELMATGDTMELMVEHEGEVVGTIGLHFNWKHGQGGLGYLLHESARGRGIASVMLQVVLDHCLDVLGLHRIWAETWPDNEPSRALLSRNGFTCEGLKRQAYCKEERYLDAEMWAILATDARPWKEQTS